MQPLFRGLQKYTSRSFARSFRVVGNDSVNDDVEFGLHQWLIGGTGLQFLPQLSRRQQALIQPLRQLSPGSQWEELLGCPQRDSSGSWPRAFKADFTEM